MQSARQYGNSPVVARSVVFSRGKGREQGGIAENSEERSAAVFQRRKNSSTRDRRVARSRIVLRALELSRSGCVYPREISYRLLNVTNNGPYRRLTVFVETCRCGAFFTVGSLANRCVRTLISPKKNRVRTVFRVSVRLTVHG